MKTLTLFYLPMFNLPMAGHSVLRSRRVALAALALCSLSACGLLPKPTPQSSFYALGSDSAAVLPTPAGSAALLPPVPVARAGTAPSTLAPTLVVNPTLAASGYGSPRIVYQRQPQQLEYFANSEWIDTPARMLSPLLLAALDASGAFAAVVQTPSAAAGDIRLDTEIIRLQHNFPDAASSQPSRVRFTLRATLVDGTTRNVLAWREFDDSVVAATNDPYGGVVAANRAVVNVLAQLADFCGQTARQWQARPVPPGKR